MISIVEKGFKGERMSFLQLINSYCIVIPVIQRDYAQGRTDEHVTEIRQNFIRALISYIKDSKRESHDLDFIYGTVNETSNGTQEFIPLDGQQRLTTLFLLHWYVAGMSGHFNEFTQMMKAAEKVYKFTYKTRSSSSMFCEKILTQDALRIYDSETDNIETDVFKELKNQKGEKTISDILQNMGWFSLSWNDDPTVAGMLVMLTEIESQFSDQSTSLSCDEAYKRLFVHDNDSQQPITFQLLPLNGYNRTDDLYIKLNARGIHLSDFEIFKARIEDLMDMDEMDCKSDFVSKVDVTWSEYLWKYRGNTDNTDAIMENLFRNFIAFNYQTKDKEEVRDRMDYLLEQNKKKMRFTYYQYCDLKVMHRRDESVLKDQIDAEKNMIKKIIGFFDLFCEDNTNPINFQSQWVDFKAFITEKGISQTATYHDRLLLYAYMQYCYKHVKEGIDQTDLQEWLRFIRNLDKATDIDDSSKFYQSLRSVDNILETIGQYKVQNWLASNAAREYSIRFFRARQMKEECIKAQLISREAELLRSINDIAASIAAGDKDGYFTGQMGFALEFAGAYEMYENNQILQATSVEINLLSKNIKKYIETTIAIIAELKRYGNELESKCLLERALLSLGLYMRANSSNRYNFCNSLYDPYNSWKTLLFVENDNKLCREIFKKMLDQIKSKDTIIDDLQLIITDHENDLQIPRWRKMIIKNKENIEYCHQGFIYVHDKSKIDDINADPDILLFSQSQKNHYHAELYTYDLYMQGKRSGKRWCYRVQKSFDDDKCISIPFLKDGNYFEFLLKHWNGQWQFWTRDVNWNNVSNDFTYEFTVEQNGSKIIGDGKTILDKVEIYLNDNNYSITKMQN